MIEIKKFRNVIGMSQREFSTYFCIPIGTLRNWEQGISSPPKYVFEMIGAILMRDEMINIETIKFTKMLDELAELSKNGIDEFKNATEENQRSKIFYDKHSEDENGNYRVVLDACILDDTNCYHHDVISYYDSEAREYEIRVVFDEYKTPFVEVKMFLRDDSIVIENGRWYFA